MSTAPTRPQPATQTQEAPAKPGLLEQVIANTLQQKVQKIDKALLTRADEIERLLPNFMKGQAVRLIARAKQYFARGNKKLHDCTEASFVKCVLEAAELGFAIDGKMVHAVPYNCKLLDAEGREQRDQYGKPLWGYEAQLIPDYKGLIAAAKRCKILRDCWARIIYASDEFSYEEQDGVVQYHHRPDLARERDSLEDATCILAVATHADGWFRTEIMPTSDILKIRARSKSYKDAESKTPWNTDPGEMAKKTALKRLLKTFSDDPGLIRLMELDDQQYAASDEHPHATAPEASSDAPKQSMVERMAAELKARQTAPQTTTPAPQNTEAAEQPPDPTPPVVPPAPSASTTDRKSVV
jgi:phage RecT family recombinase